MSRNDEEEDGPVANPRDSARRLSTTDNTLMLGRGWMFFFLLGGAIGPYLVSSNSSVRDALSSPFKAWSGSSSDTASPAAGTASAGGPGESAPPNAAATGVSPSANAPAQSAASGGPQAAAAQPRTASDVRLVPLEQALQWNVKPAWVLSNWPRVTTALPELDLNGYRVSYVSGTTPSDIAGSLSYYFDTNLQLRRIKFQGSTGDARRLVQFLMSQHRFARRMDLDKSTYLYQVEQDGQALSDLRIKTAPIVRAEAALARFDVTLEMRRPEE